MFNWFTSVQTENENATSTDKNDSRDVFKIVVILDESGSMRTVKDKMVESLNSLISEQQEIDRPCRFTLVKFNETVKGVVRNADLKTVKPLREGDYRPEKTTALYDAIGETFEWFRDEKNVLAVIVTDGQENASRRFGYQQISQLIQRKQRELNWSFVYLCNDLSTSHQGAQIGLSSCGYATNCIRERDHFGSYLAKDVSQAISNYRTTGLSVQSQLNKSIPQEFNDQNPSKSSSSWGWI
jgi:hypothetical protein